MASITISSPGGVQTNPTDTLLPFNNGGIFGDSSLAQGGTNVLFTQFTGGSTGLYIDLDLGNFLFGDYDGVFTGANITVLPDGTININASNKLILNTNLSIEMTGLITSPTAGGSSGQHLELTINGTKYKIALLNA